MSSIQNKYDFIVLFDVENGNPNGDPDAGNMPRVDPETSYGIITDVCIKRKVRNFVDIYKEGEPGYNILIKSDKALNTKFTEAYTACDLKKAQKGKNIEDVKVARDYMCQNYFDVRTFGAVMSTGDDQCGIVRGPVQFNFAKSLDPIFPQEITITRQAKTTVQRKEAGDTEMGKKNIVPYGLYKMEGYISALLAQKVTGFSEEDLELLWIALKNMFEEDHSAARGKMTVRKLIIFKHDSALGNYPSNLLFDKVHICKKDEEAVPRQYSDYSVSIDPIDIKGVSMIER